MHIFLIQQMYNLSIVKLLTPKYIPVIPALNFQSLDEHS